MLIDLKAHYLDLLVNAIEAGGNACLHRPLGEDRGAIYVTRSAKETRSDFAIQYYFDERSVRMQFDFRDGRKLQWEATYVEGLDSFWPQLRKVLDANKLVDRSHEPERGPKEPYELRGARKPVTATERWNR